jgi:hypothetical protein
LPLQADARLSAGSQVSEAGVRMSATVSAS